MPHKIYLIIIFLIAISFPSNISRAASETLTDTRVENLIEALSQSDNESKKFYIGYFSGIQDATMNMGLHFKIWCFPNPMPSRKEFLDQYLADYMRYSEKVGQSKARIMEMDQMLFMSWGERYLCPDAPIKKP